MPACCQAMICAAAVFLLSPDALLLHSSWQLSIRLSPALPCSSCHPVLDGCRLPLATPRRLQRKCDAALEQLQKAVHGVVQLQTDLSEPRSPALEVMRQQQAVQRAISQAVSQLQLNDLS